MHQNYFSRLRRPMLCLLIPILNTGCTTATLSLKNSVLNVSGKLPEYSVVDCKKLDGEVTKDCSINTLNHIKKCRGSIESNKADSGNSNVKITIEIIPTGSGIGWTSLSIFSIGIIPTYSTVAVEKIRVVDIANDREIARWENLIQIQGGWLNLINAEINKNDPNDYCEQFKRVIAEPNGP